MGAYSQTLHQTPQGAGVLPSVVAMAAARSGPALFGVDPGADDAALLGLATDVRSQGGEVLGYVQVRGQPQAGCKCRMMHLVDLRTGACAMISEDRGSQARGCHLDWSALAQAALQVETAITVHTDLVIVNRFGRAEAEGRGMIGAIEKAVSLGVPVLVGVRDTYADAWQAFHGGLARDLTLDPQGVPLRD